MPCYHPLSAWRDGASGAIEFVDRGRGDRIDLPCGRCIGCRLERSRHWATRIMFESQLHNSNCFITLTYDDAYLPSPSLDHSHFQKFMKRLRKRCGAVRFYMCGEYGPINLRPHFHACIFGFDFPDRVFWSVSPSGHDLFRSPLLESLWTFGYSSVADLSFDSAAYVARYVLKKVTGDLAESHYSYVDPETGEVCQRVPEYARMSLKPGIGAAWFDKYHLDVYNDDRDFVVINGRTCKPPRYFDKLLRRSDPKLYEYVKSDRSCGPASEHSSASRLVVAEEVQLAALKRLTPRSL